MHNKFTIIEVTDCDYCKSTTSFLYETITDIFSYIAHQSQSTSISIIKFAVTLDFW